VADGMDWRDVAVAYPEFVQWIVAKFGPLPDGPVRQADYEKFRTAYERKEELRR
jgi:hypothetical protein